MPGRDTAASEQALAFGPFQLFRSQKMLLESGRPMRLGSRAFEILVALVERAGEVVGKNELTACAWPNMFVEESNLRVHVAAIRRILGDGQGQARYIINVSGRGYSFIAPVTRIDGPQPAVQSANKARRALPAPLTRAIGRDEAVSAVVGQVSRRRLVTIVGPGGVGKSTVALAAAEQLAEPYAQRVCFADLAAVEDAALVPAALATVIGISALVRDPIGSLIANLRDARMLIVLDNCEHVIAVAAELVERVLHSAPDVTVLATSREPLLAEGESGRTSYLTA